MLHVVAAILRDRDKMLICQRGGDDECALLWEFPGGKVEPDEIEEAAIIREIREELALDIEVDSVYARTEYFFAGSDIFFTFFNAHITGGKMRLNVHHDVRWVTPEELKDFSFMPPDQEVLDRLSQGKSGLTD